MVKVFGCRQAYENLHRGSHSLAIRRMAVADPTWSYAELAGDPGTGHSAPGGTDGCAPIKAVQTSGTVSPEQSFMAAAANGWDGWIPAVPARLTPAQPVPHNT
jgi:hypothetical protein